jgi:hypothetical protein
MQTIRMDPPSYPPSQNFLFDPMGNQSRALYQMASSGHHTCIGPTDWLAGQVSKKANACMNEDVLNEYDRKFEALVRGSCCKIER